VGDWADKMAQDVFNDMWMAKTIWQPIIAKHLRKVRADALEEARQACEAYADEKDALVEEYSVAKRLSFIIANMKDA